MKKLIIISLLIVVAIRWSFLVTEVESSGTYTPAGSVPLQSPDSVKEIMENPSAYFDKNFETIPSFGVDKAWRHLSDEQIILTKLSERVRRKFNLSNFTKSKYVEALPSTRRIVHFLSGINDWKINRATLAKSKRAILIRLNGSYKRRSGEVVRFHEWHFFKGHRFTQYQMIINDKSKVKLDRKVVGALFKNLVEGS